MPTTSVSDYWWNRCSSIVKSGLRHSVAQIISEALEKYWPSLEREQASWEEFKEEKKNE